MTGRAAWGWDEAEIAVLRVLGAVGRQVAQVLRCAVRGARHAGQAEAVVRVPDPADDAAAVPHRDDRAGRCWASSIAARNGSFDLVAALLTDHRRVVRPARAQRRQRRLRHRPGRRRRERHAHPVQRRVAGHPVRAGVAAPDGDPRDRLLSARRRRSGWSCWRRTGRTALLVIGVVGFVVSLGYTAPPLKFVYRGLGEIAVALGFGPLMLLGAYVVQTGGALVLGAVRGVDPGRPARGADPVRQRDPGPSRRRAGRQADPARAVLARRRSSRATTWRPCCAYVILVARGGRRDPAGPRAADAADHPAGACASRAASRPNYDNPYGLMAIMGIERPAPPAGGPAACWRPTSIVLILGAIAPSLDLFLG